MDIKIWMHNGCLYKAVFEKQTATFYDAKDNVLLYRKNLSKPEETRIKNQIITKGMKNLIGFSGD